jgi:hypothetical protein
MTSLARSSGGGSDGALFSLSGVVAINATWSEDIYFTEAGTPMELTGLDFKLTLRSAQDSNSATYTLSIDAGTLSIEDDSDGYSRILRISVAPGVLSCVGDFIADLASEDGDEAVTHWAHGVITLRNNPVVF